MTNILALPRKQSNSWNNSSSDRKTLQDIADSHPAANNEPLRQEETWTLSHPATPSSYKVLPPFSPQGIMQFSWVSTHTRGHRTEHSQQHRHLATRGHLLQPSPMPCPEMWRHLSTPSLPSSSPGCLLLPTSRPESIHLHCTQGSSAQSCPTTSLPQADVPRSTRHRETTSTCTPAHTTSCPGLPHSTPQASNSRDTA